MNTTGNSDPKQTVLGSLNSFNCWETLLGLQYIEQRQSAAKLEREGSTTIESIAIEKYYSEEVSRVGEIRNGEHPIFGNRIWGEDIV